MQTILASLFFIASAAAILLGFYIQNKLEILFLGKR